MVIIHIMVDITHTQYLRHSVIKINIPNSVPIFLLTHIEGPRLVVPRLVVPYSPSATEYSKYVPCVGKTHISHGNLHCQVIPSNVRQPQTCIVPSISSYLAKVIIIAICSFEKYE